MNVFSVLSCQDIVEMIYLSRRKYISFVKYKPTKHFRDIINKMKQSNMIFQKYQIKLINPYKKLL